jgi:SAM-dependent methyltransferase
MATHTHSEMDGYAATLDSQVREVWPNNYANNLSDFLNDSGVSRLLDCAGGTGFPAIELKEAGWDITYSDGSADMMNFFKEKVAEKDLLIPSYLSLWQDLPEVVPNTFDAVLCRGNSLLGVCAYNGETMPSRPQILATMIEALKGMFNKVADGGFLYIDIPIPSRSKPAEPYVFNSQKYIATTIIYDPVTQIRTTEDVKTNPDDGSEQITYHFVYPLDPEELIDMLLQVGFQKIEKSSLEEAFYIDAYVAFK